MAKKKSERRLVLDEVVATLALCHRTLLLESKRDGQVWDPKETLEKEIKHIYGSMIELNNLP
jgi:hypothetical protein